MFNLKNQKLCAIQKNVATEKNVALKNQALNEYMLNLPVVELDYRKMATRFKTRENAKPSKPEVNNLPSQTIPDASISMRQILDRFQRGIPVTRTLRTPQYNEDFNYPDNMEFDDIHNAKLQMREDVKRKKSEYARQEKERKKKTIDGSQEKSSEPSA